MIGEEVIAVYGDAGDGEELFEVQKLVRCKECKHWHEFVDAKGQGRCDADEHNPFRVSIGISTADFYCSYGERKESE